MPNTSLANELKAVIDLIRDAYAPNTIRAYLADMQEFISHCGATGARALPAQPATVAGFILGAAETGVTSATIRRKVASISAIHRYSGHHDPTKEPQVRLAVRKVNRKLGTRFKQAYPVTKLLLRRLLASCGDDLIGLRNRALLLVAYDSLQRRSELTALSASDLELNPDGTITLLQRRSKTDQQGSGRWIHLGFEASEALSDWLKAAGISDGFVFRAIGPRSDVLSDLSSGQIGRIFKSLAQRAGLGSDVVGAISGHSLRVGAAQDLLMKGASLPQIMVKGGWGKTDTVMRYVERVRPSSHL